MMTQKLSSFAEKLSQMEKQVNDKGHGTMCICEAGKKLRFIRKIFRFL